MFQNFLERGGLKAKMLLTSGAFKKGDTVQIMNMRWGDIVIKKDSHTGVVSASLLSEPFIDSTPIEVDMSSLYPFDGGIYVKKDHVNLRNWPKVCGMEDSRIHFYSSTSQISTCQIIIGFSLASDNEGHKLQDKDGDFIVHTNEVYDFLKSIHRKQDSYQLTLNLTEKITNPKHQDKVLFLLELLN